METNPPEEIPEETLVDDTPTGATPETLPEELEWEPDIDVPDDPNLEVGSDPGYPNVVHTPKRIAQVQEGQS